MREGERERRTHTHDTHSTHTHTRHTYTHRQEREREREREREDERGGESETDPRISTFACALDRPFRTAPVGPVARSIARAYLIYLIPILTTPRVYP